MAEYAETNARPAYSGEPIYPPRAGRDPRGKGPRVRLRDDDLGAGYNLRLQPKDPPVQPAESVSRCTPPAGCPCPSMRSARDELKLKISQLLERSTTTIGRAYAGGVQPNCRGPMQCTHGADAKRLLPLARFHRGGREWASGGMRAAVACNRPLATPRLLALRSGQTGPMGLIQGHHAAGPTQRQGWT